jgi:hypothetical protein
MDKEISTETPTSTPQKGETLPSRQIAAYELKQSGLSLSEIADRLGYASAAEVTQSIRQRMSAERQFMTDVEREGLLTLQAARYEAVLSAHWTAMQMGDPASSNIVLKALADLNRILGLNEITAQVDKMQVLVIGGAEADYIHQLKLAVDG